MLARVLLRLIDIANVCQTCADSRGGMRRTEWNEVWRRRKVQLAVGDLTSQVRNHDCKALDITMVPKLILVMRAQIFRWLCRFFVIVSFGVTTQTSDEAEDNVKFNEQERTTGNTKTVLTILPKHDIDQQNEAFLRLAVFLDRPLARLTGHSGKERPRL